ncbi:MAG: site-specific DNA-methyltransferase, partial [Elusimicrobia bacterium]|nr:site-specific DNA-methyltransferase [Elusimicrobiota bacterium]
MPRKTKTLNHVPVEATVHKKDKRANIPTQELHDFVKDDEKKPKMILYPRDPSLDPQLVWKGQDERDSKDLAVPAVPIYIQEKISPQALIENLRREKGRQQEEPGLFDNFNGIEFEKLVEFYQHEQNWSNRMILGDSLLVMNSMAEKEGLKGKVQMIYMDPPYGIKFGSNWQVSTRKRDVKDGKAEDATREPEQIKAFRDTWEFGIHSYLAYLRDRLTVTRELLAESGSIFMQIGDENVHLVRNLLDEVFGSENFCAVVTFTKATAQSSELLSSASDYLLWYAKNKTGVKSRSLYWPKQAGAIGATNYVNVESPDGKTWKPLTASEKQDPTQISEGWRLFSADNLMGTRPATEGDLGAYKFEGKVYNGDKRKCWKTDKAGLDSLAVAKRLIVIGDGIYYKRYLDDFPVYPMTTNWIDTASSFMTDKIY